MRNNGVVVEMEKPSRGKRALKKAAAQEESVALARYDPLSFLPPPERRALARSINITLDEHVYQRMAALAFQRATQTAKRYSVAELARDLIIRTFAP